MFTQYSTSPKKGAGSVKHKHLTLAPLLQHEHGCVLNCVQEEQLYTWASVGLPVSPHLWDMYGGRSTGQVPTMRSPLNQSSAKTPGAPLSQVNI